MRPSLPGVVGAAALGAALACVLLRPGPARRTAAPSDAPAAAPSGQADAPPAAAPAAAPPPAWQRQAAVVAAARHLRPELWDESEDGAVPAPPTGYMPDAKGPCWRSGGNVWCLPWVYLIGVYQGGVKGLWADLHARLQPADVGPLMRPGNSAGGHYAFVEGPAGKRTKWERLLKSTSKVAARVAAGELSAVTGDGSGAMLTHYWAMSAESVHSAFHRSMLPCWQSCQRHRSHTDRRNCIDQDSGCRGQARRAEDAAQDAAGVPRGADGEWAFTVPWLLRAVQGADRVRLVAVLREPVRRLHASFWHYRHYPARYNGTEEGFLAFVEEQVAGFRQCTDAGFTVRRCALEFESLLPSLEKVFFHCDQLIRGLYSVFMQDWLAAFPRSRLLVLRSEDLWRDPEPALELVAAHVGMRVGTARVSAPAPRTPAREMLPAARSISERFYAADKAALARMLGDDRFRWADVAG